MRRVSLGAAALLAVIVLYGVAVIVQIDRPPSSDEAEFLNGAARIAKGARLYIDFAEHHPPFAFLLLSKLAGPDVRVALIRGRIVFGILGAIAVGLMAWLVWRATHRFEAAAVAVALLMSGVNVWSFSFNQIRSEPLALALFLGGAACVFLGRPIVRGCGIGLVVLACLILPKWPLEAAVVGAVFVARLVRDDRRRFAAVAAAAVSSGAAVGLLALLVPLDRYVFQVFTLNVAVLEWTRNDPAFAPSVGPFFQVSRLLYPMVVVPAAVVICGLALRGAWPERQIAIILVCLAAAALIEVRFLYFYPRNWPHYYAFWSLAAAAVVAISLQLIAELLARQTPRIAPVARAIPFAVVLIAVTVMQTSFFWTRTPHPYWMADKLLRSKLGGGTQWLDFRGKPIGAAEASYYTFGFADFLPGSLRAAKTAQGRRYLPPIGEEDLPPCRLEKGLEPRLRLLSYPPYELPVARGCFERLRAAGRVVPLPGHGAWEVR